MDIKEEYLKKIIEAVDQLPPLPESIVKLREATSKADVTYLDLVPLIEQDPAMVADILHVVNSAFYSLNHHVESISEALRYLGMTNLINFITLSFSNRVIKNEFNAISGLNEYFAHSKTIAFAAKALSKEAGYGRQEKELLYLAGLLHDMGRLILIVVAEKSGAELLHMDDWAAIEEIAENEKEVLGINHCHAGKEISQKWEFSEKLQDALLYHHTPFVDGIHKEAAIIFLAHFLTMENVSDEMLCGIFPADKKEELGLSDTIILNARKAFFSENG